MSERDDQRDGNARKAHFRIGDARFVVACFPLDHGDVEAERSSRLGSLTGTEREIVDAVGRGCSNKDIAAARGCRVRTIANHLYNIFRKVGVGSRSELVAIVNGR